MDWSLALAGLAVGSLVGLTGMGGGALMTPVLVLIFKVEPLTAVSSDLVASFFMKPVGAAVHLRRGTVNLHLVKWLCLGSVPAAFVGVFVLRALGQGQDIQEVVKTALGVALLVAAAGLIAKAYLTLRGRPAPRVAGAPSAPVASGMPSITVKPLPTVVIGVIGGLVVGMTSVGSGSLIIVALLALYPMLRASQLVGTDLVQAVPLGRRGLSRAPALRRLPTVAHNVAAGGRDPRRVCRRPGLGSSTGRRGPSGAGPGLDRVRPQAARCPDIEAVLDLARCGDRWAVGVDVGAYPVRPSRPRPLGAVAEPAARRVGDCYSPAVIMPAATVRLVDSSMRMNPPVHRFRA